MIQLQIKMIKKKMITKKINKSDIEANNPK